MEITLSFMDLLVGAVVLFQTILKWGVTESYFFYSRLLSFYPFKIQSIWAKPNSNETATKSTPTQQLPLNELVEGDVAKLRGEEIELVMGKMGLSCSPDEENGNQRIVESLCEREFSSLFEETEPSLEELKEAFAVFDVNRDGFIDAAELQRVLCNLGFREAMEMEACERMIGALDKKRRGRVDFFDFVRLLENSFA